MYIIFVVIIIRKGNGRTAQHFGASGIFLDFFHKSSYFFEFGSGDLQYSYRCHFTFKFPFFLVKIERNLSLMTWILGGFNPFGW